MVVKIYIAICSYSFREKVKNMVLMSYFMILVGAGHRLNKAQHWNMIHTNNGLN